MGPYVKDLSAMWNEVSEDEKAEFNAEADQENNGSVGAEAGKRVYSDV